jgi:hypothetical protein
VVGHRQPVEISIPNTAESAEKRIVSSNVHGMNDGHEKNGRPPTFSG